jgi:hypothetical protein
VARSPVDVRVRNGAVGPDADHREEVAAGSHDRAERVASGGGSEGGINLGDPGPERPSEVRGETVATGIAERLLASASRRGMAPPDDENVRRMCPFLWELLTLTTYKDGTARAMPSIKIERTGGGYIATFQDHASNKQLRVPLQKLQDLARTLEAAMAEGRAEWTEYRSYVVKDPRKRPKAEGS